MKKKAVCEFQHGDPGVGFLLVLVAGLACSLASCGKEPRSRDAIFAERMELPRLYMTLHTLREVTAPSGKGIFVDEQTGEVCWPVLACHNPDCPGRTADGQPYLFIAPDPNMVVQSDGTIGYDAKAPAPPANPRISLDGTCPACRKTRNLKTESPETVQRYVNWVKPHVLPETAERERKLDEEARRRVRR